MPGAKFITIEAQSESVRLARKSIEWNGLRERFDIREGDFRTLAIGRQFDLVMGSPPYFPQGSGVEGDHPQKILCRFETRGDIADYCLAAARHLSSGGVFAVVFPVNPDSQFERVQQGARGAGLVIVRWRPVVLRQPERPLLGLFVMMRAEDLPEGFRNQTWREPELVIRQMDGTIHPEYSAVKMGFGFPP
jgi:tRNA1(Val) A37 N6-methylase TrmN6